MMLNSRPMAGPQPSRSSIAPPPREARHIDSRHLLAGGKELVIEHAGQRYHLRLTRNDKLILTK